MRAMLAAMVMQRVPAGHSLLCCNPASEYVCVCERMYPCALATSPVWING